MVDAHAHCPWNRAPSNVVLLRHIGGTDEVVVVVLVVVLGSAEVVVCVLVDT